VHARLDLEQLAPRAVGDFPELAEQLRGQERLCRAQAASTRARERLRKAWDGAFAPRRGKGGTGHPRGVAPRASRTRGAWLTRMRTSRAGSDHAGSKALA